MNLELRIENLINDHYDKLSEIDKFVFGTNLSYAFFQDKYSELLEQYKENDKGMKIFKDLNMKIPEYESEVLTTALINFIARTEAFLNDLLEILFLWKKKSLISNKNLSYKEIIECENLDDLIKTIREKEILEFSHSSFKDKIDYFKSKFNLSFPGLDDNLDQIIEMFTTRNIILHNNGIVNETYLKINKDSNLEKGSKRIIDKDYSHNVYIYSMIIAKSIGEIITSKVKN